MQKQGNLFCNARKCRKQITSGSAWATSCCHIFCYDDGKRIIDNGKVCPACSSRLNGKRDIITFDTNPDNTYRSMVLLGQRPDVVLDICQKAISVWVYQYNQELLCRQALLVRSDKKFADLKRYCEQVCTKLQEENKALKAEVSSLKRNIEEISSLLTTKTHQCKKLEAMCSHYKRMSHQPSTECCHRSDGGGDMRSSKEDLRLAFDKASGSRRRAQTPVDKFFSSSSTPKRFNFEIPPSTSLFGSRTPDASLLDSFTREFCERMEG